MRGERVQPGLAILFDIRALDVRDFAEEVSETSTVLVGGSFHSACDEQASRKNKGGKTDLVMMGGPESTRTQIHVDRILRRVIEDQRRVGAPVFARRRRAV